MKKFIVLLTLCAITLAGCGAIEEANDKLTNKVFDEVDDLVQDVLEDIMPETPEPTGSVVDTSPKEEPVPSTTPEVTEIPPVEVTDTPTVTVNYKDVVDMTPEEKDALIETLKDFDEISLCDKNFEAYAYVMCWVDGADDYIVGEYTLQCSGNVVHNISESYLWENEKATESKYESYDVKQSEGITIRYLTRENANRKTDWVKQETNDEFYSDPLYFVTKGDNEMAVVESDVYYGEPVYKLYIPLQGESLDNFMSMFPELKYVSEHASAVYIFDASYDLIAHEVNVLLKDPASESNKYTHASVNFKLDLYKIPEVTIPDYVYRFVGEVEDTAPSSIIALTEGFYESVGRLMWEDADSRTTITLPADYGWFYNNSWEYWSTLYVMDDMYSTEDPLYEIEYSQSRMLDVKDATLEQIKNVIYPLQHKFNKDMFYECTFDDKPAYCYVDTSWGYWVEFNILQDIGEDNFVSIIVTDNSEYANVDYSKRAQEIVDMYALRKRE